jgi:hypothetical protein
MLNALSLGMCRQGIQYTGRMASFKDVILMFKNAGDASTEISQISLETSAGRHPSVQAQALTTQALVKKQASLYFFQFKLPWLLSKPQLA